MSKRLKLVSVRLKSDRGVYKNATFATATDVAFLMAKEIAEFENISLSIMVERSLNYARSGDFKRANKLKKKTKIYAKNKRKFANYKAKQKDEPYQKCLFN